MKTLTRLLCCALLLAVAPLTVNADSPTSATVQTRVKRVALFKNGFGFFVREGTLPASQNVIVTGPFAAPAHGTYWISVPTRAGLASAIARETIGGHSTPAVSIAELLRGNVGRTVSIWLEPDAKIIGKILAFAPDRRDAVIMPYAAGQRPDRPQIFPPPSMGDYLLIETQEGVFALNHYRINRVAFLDGPPNTNFPHPIPQIEVQLNLKNSAPGDWLSISYLAKGITWAPSYLVDISETGKARLSAKALIINEAEDLENAHVDLITGFPHLQFANIVSPAGRRESLAQFLQSLARGVSRPDYASVVTQNVALMRAGMGGQLHEMAPDMPVMPDYGEAAVGQTAEDLFLYPLENVTLRREETGYFPLFSVSIPSTQFYEWNIPDYLSPEGFHRPMPSVEIQQPEIVWHSLRLTNSTAMPWTTAPVQVLKDGQIIGQDTLNYTAPTSENTVKITQAVNVKAEQNEYEVGRERGAVTLAGISYDKVTIQGDLVVTNYKSEAISLEITKTISGDLISINPPAEHVALARGLRSLNPTRRLTWKIEIDPSQTSNLTYTYEALVRR